MFLDKLLSKINRHISPLHPTLQNTLITLVFLTLAYLSSTVLGIGCRMPKDA